MKFVSKSVNTSIWRVLVTTLSIMCITGNSFVVYGYTNDDIRELVGEQRLDNQDYIKKLQDVIKIRDRAVEIGNMADAINEISSNNTAYEKISDINKEISELNSRLVELENNLAKPNDILGVIKQIEALDSEKSKLDVLIIDTEIDVDDTKYEEEYNYAMNKMQYVNDEFDLGNIATDTPNPYGSAKLSLYEPYGDIRNLYNLDEIYHNNGIYIKKPGDKNDTSLEHIRSIFSGVVIGIVENDPTWGSYITVKHGKGLETSYSFLNKVNVIVGQEIKQGHIIGESNNEYIYLEVKLDNHYIDPIYLFGKQGIAAYNDWISVNNERAESKIDVSDIQVSISNKTDE